MANWDQLLPDLLTMIAKKIEIYEDFAAFGGVCKSWISAAVKDIFNQHLAPSSSGLVVQPPWFMLAESETEPHMRKFVNLLKGGMSRKTELPEVKGKWCVGSMGWLITLDEEGGMELVHPLTRAVICLPHLKTFRFYEEQIQHHCIRPIRYVYRASLSASPSATDDYVVMLILGIPAMLAFWKPHAGWTLVRSGSGAAMYYVTCHKDKFYAIDFTYNIFVCDVRGPNPINAHMVGAVLPRSMLFTDGQLYLTDCCGDLHLVKREIVHWDMDSDDDIVHLDMDSDDEDDKDDDGVNYSYSTGYFRIFKPAADDDSSASSYSKWQEIFDLGGSSIL